MPTAVEIDKTLILSTAHVSAEPDESGEPPYRYEDLGVDDTCDVRVSRHEYGWDVVITCALEDMGDLGSVTVTGLDPVVPDWMKPAILLAAASGCRRISYDCDARATPEVSVPGYPGRVFTLPVYDW